MRKRLLINGLIISWAIAAGVFVSIKPWQVYRKQNEDAIQRKREMHDAESRRDDLLRKEARAQSSVGREELARKAGYLAPGESSTDTDKK